MKIDIDTAVCVDREGTHKYKYYKVRRENFSARRRVAGESTNTRWLFREIEQEDE